mmetsp:Transcript_39961/g.95366  ORF Transcript_39961/g.95366 Transcript_39961/m.95366 type:complete len:339 (+) Transcript_39961:94-1110(+)
MVSIGRLSGCFASSHMLRMHLCLKRSVASLSTHSLLTAHCHFGHFCFSLCSLSVRGARGGAECRLHLAALAQGRGCQGVDAGGGEVLEAFEGHLHGVLQASQDLLQVLLILHDAFLHELAVRIQEILALLQQPNEASHLVQHPQVHCALLRGHVILAALQQKLGRGGVARDLPQLQVLHHAEARVRISGRRLQAQVLDLLSVQLQAQAVLGRRLLHLLRGLGVLQQALHQPLVGVAPETSLVLPFPELVPAPLQLELELFPRQLQVVHNAHRGPTGGSRLTKVLNYDDNEKVQHQKHHHQDEQPVPNGSRHRGDYIKLVEGRGPHHEEDGAGTALRIC